MKMKMHGSPGHEKREASRVSAPIAGRSGAGTLAEQAYEHLEELIVTLVYPPGSLLSEGVLSGRLGLGRTPVREALQRLASEHLVVIMPRRGVRVSNLNVEQQLLVLDVRRELERLIAARAAGSITVDKRKRLVEMADEITAATRRGDEIMFLRLDRECDTILVECARNPYAASAIGPLHVISRRFWYAHRSHMTDMQPMGEVHSEVLRAVAAGDDREAAAAAERMMDFIEEFTRSTLESL
jgi:DNA-binding GntR family transcriptional regulator